MIKLHITITALIIASLLISITTAAPISTTNTQTATTTKNAQKTLLTNEQIFIKINKIICHNNPDPWPWAEKADLKIKVTLEGETYSKTYDDDHNTITKSWIMSHTITENKDNININFKLIDRDPDANDVCDINPDSEKKTCDITYNLAEDKWTGDDNGDGHIAGNSKPRCELWFDISHTGGDDFKVDAHGPYEGVIYEEIQLTATASGGKPPYKDWHWTICNKDTGENIAEFYEQNPSYTFTEKGYYQLSVEVYDQDNDRAIDNARAEILGSEEKKKLALLIAGGTGSDRDEYYDVIAFDTYNFLFHHIEGYSSDNIYYLSPTIEDKGEWRVDAKTTKSNIKKAITDWLKDNSDRDTNCLIYLISTGLPFPYRGAVGAHPGRPYAFWEMIFPHELDKWIDEVEYNTCTVIIDSDFSGWFIPSLSQKNRIVITTTDMGSTVWQEDFAYPFFGKLAGTCSKSSIGEAWMAADWEIDKYGAIKSQNLLIDDNGDGIGHGTSEVDSLPLGGDGHLALKTYP